LAFIIRAYQDAWYSECQICHFYTQNSLSDLISLDFVHHVTLK